MAWDDLFKALGIGDCWGITLTVHAPDCEDTQARYHVSGHDDVLWTDDPEEALRYVRAEVELLTKNPKGNFGG